MHKRLKALQIWIARFAEYLLVILTAAFVIATWLLDFIVPNDKSTVSILQLLIGLTAASIVVAVKQSLDEIQQQTEKLTSIEARQTKIDTQLDQAVRLAIMEGFEDAIRNFGAVKSFRTHNDSYQAMFDSLHNAKSSIDIISHQELIVRDPLRSQYFEEIKATINRGIEHRRIVWNFNHLQWLETRFAEGWDRLPGLSIRLLPVTMDQELVTFDLIDLREVILAQGWRGSGILKIEDEEAAKYFAAYFLKMWEQARFYVIKDGNSPPDLVLLKRLKNKLKSKSNESQQ